MIRFTAIRPRGLAARLLIALGAMLALSLGVSDQVQSAVGSSARARLVRVGRFHFPTYIAGTPADPHAFYVVERTGRIWIVRHGQRIGRPFLDLRHDISLFPNSEQGLLSMAFAPNYKKSRIYYVYYSNRQGNIRVKQFRTQKRDRNRTQAGSGRTILAIPHPLIAHYAGQLQFGPRDRDLYISVGDGGAPGGAGNTAQDLSRLLGKILRIDPSRQGRHHPYVIPRGNPFSHHHGRARAEVYAYGLRNPFRFSIDPVTGGVWIGDVGENTYEEVDYRRRGHLAGTNFGWPRYEGDSFFRNVSAPHAVFPVIVERHGGAGGSRSGQTWCAVIGGYVERDRSVPALYGRYLFADHCTGRIFSARISSKGRAYAVGPTGLQVGGLLTSFGTDAQQRLYIASEDGSVYRFVG